MQLTSLRLSKLSWGQSALSKEQARGCLHQRQEGSTPAAGVRWLPHWVACWPLQSSWKAKGMLASQASLPSDGERIKCVTACSRGAPVATCSHQAGCWSCAAGTGEAYWARRRTQLGGRLEGGNPGDPSKQAASPCTAGQGDKLKGSMTKLAKQHGEHHSAAYWQDAKCWTAAQG